MRSDRVRELLESFAPPVYRFALRLTGDPHVAEELTQETMLRAWRHRRRLRDERAARTWLFRVTANLWNDERRRRKLAQRASQANTHPGQPIEHPEDVAAVLEAIERLPARQREILFLRDCEGLDHGQIAEVLAISREAVKSSLSLARTRVRDRLTQEVDA